MTELRQRMLEELQRHNYSQETIRLYLFAVKDFARHFKKSPDLLTQEHMREFQLYLLNERILMAQTVAGRITSLRFFFVKVLRRPYQELDLVDRAWNQAGSPVYSFSCNVVAGPSAVCVC